MNKLRDAREKMGLTQAEAALGIGISLSLLQKLEQGVKTGNDRTKKAIAKFYNMPVGYLFFGEQITGGD